MGAEDEETGPEYRGAPQLLGYDSGEDQARTLLLLSLGQGWNVEQTIARGEPDELRLVTPDGAAFVVKADRLYLEWQGRGSPRLTVDKFGGVYSIERVPWRWWQRPRWAWRLWHRVPADLLYARYRDWRDR